MSKYAVLCGSAPDDFRQKKLIEMQNFLAGNAGGFVPERNICIFPNGVSELLLESVLNNMLDGSAGEKVDEVLLYFCTETPVLDDESSLWLSGEEIRKDVIDYYIRLFGEMGIGFQQIFDSDHDFVSEESLGYEKAI